MTDRGLLRPPWRIPASRRCERKVVPRRHVAFNIAKPSPHFAYQTGHAFGRSHNFVCARFYSRIHELTIIERSRTNSLQPPSLVVSGNMLVRLYTAGVNDVDNTAAPLLLAFRLRQTRRVNFVILINEGTSGPCFCRGKARVKWRVPR